MLGTCSLNCVFPPSIYSSIGILRLSDHKNAHCLSFGSRIAPYLLFFSVSLSPNPFIEVQYCNHDWDSVLLILSI